MEVDHKYDRKILSQNEEIAKIRMDKIMEARVSKIEADNAEMKTEIKVTSVRVLILATYPCFIL